MGTQPEQIEDPDGVLDKPAQLTTSGEAAVAALASGFYGIGDAGYTSVILRDEAGGRLQCFLESISSDQKGPSLELNPQQWCYK